jgi:hypothetical protein
MLSMGETAEGIVYTESVRAVTLQEAALDGLRARTGTLLAAASITTAFLGGEALAREPRLVLGSWAAITSFCLVGALAITILWPWTWRFSHDASVLIEDHIEVPERSQAEQVQLFLARTNDRNWDANQRKLDRLFWCFRVGSLFLAVEVVLWIVVLART